MYFLSSIVNAFTTDLAEVLPATLSLPELVRVCRSQNSHEAAHCTTKEAEGLAQCHRMNCDCVFCGGTVDH